MAEQQANTPPAALFKICASCKRDLPAEAFYRSKIHRLGLSSYCRACVKVKADARWADPVRSAAERQKRASPEGRAANRHSKIRAKYGLTLAAYNGLVEAQDGRCALCDRVLVIRGKFTHVDHCHSTGRVRGLLCARCNNGLGAFGDSVEQLRRAIEYLTPHLLPA